MKDHFQLYLAPSQSTQTHVRLGLRGFSIDGCSSASKGSGTHICVKIQRYHLLQELVMFFTEMAEEYFFMFWANIAYWSDKNPVLFALWNAMTTLIPGSKSKPVLGHLYTLCSKSCPALMKNTQPGNYNTRLNDPQKAVFILKQVLILKAYIKGN